MRVENDNAHEGELADNDAGDADDDSEIVWR
jgi:hypothetical protein